MKKQINFDELFEAFEKAFVQKQICLGIVWGLNLRFLDWFTYPRDIHFMYIAAFSGLILMFIPVTNISSYVTADNEFSAEATVL